MTSTINRQTDGTIELLLTIPWQNIADLHQDVVNEAIANVELPGFRKGKAPRDMALKQLDESKLYEETIRRLIPKAYQEAVDQNKLKPIVSPKIELTEAQEGKDWVIKARTSEIPVIELGDYKKAIKEAKNAKLNKIWVPGEEPKSKEEKEQKVSLDDILKALYEAIHVTIADILLDHETNRLLSDLIDQTKKLGLTVEQYLASTHRTQESVREEYKEQAKRTITLEFALEKIADTEGIIISDDDIDAVIKSAKTDEERVSMEKERYYLASILRRQKTLDFLAAL